VPEIGAGLVGRLVTLARPGDLGRQMWVRTKVVDFKMQQPIDCTRSADRVAWYSRRVVDVSA
jgi:hypothetical protein